MLRVVSFMSRHPEGVTAREVARELGKSVSTAYELLASLHEEGFALPGPRGRYRLCSATGIGGRALEPSNDDALARSVDELFARTHRRSYLARVERGAIVITAVCGRQGIPQVPRLGRRIGSSAHALAMGKVVLSLLPEHSRRRYIERSPRRFTPHTMISPGALMSELEQVRNSGFAVNRGEFDARYSCVAAPVFDAEGRFLAVLGLSSLSRTFDDEAHDLVGSVRAVASAVSAEEEARTSPGGDVRAAYPWPGRAA